MLYKEYIHSSGLKNIKLHFKHTIYLTKFYLTMLDPSIEHLNNVMQQDYDNIFHQRNALTLIVIMLSAYCIYLLNDRKNKITQSPPVKMDLDGILSSFFSGTNDTKSTVTKNTKSPVTKNSGVVRKTFNEDPHLIILNQRKDDNDEDDVDEDDIDKALSLARSKRSSESKTEDVFHSETAELLSEQFGELKGMYGKLVGTMTDEIISKVTQPTGSFVSFDSEETLVSENKINIEEVD